MELYNSIFKENRVYDASGYGAHGGAISLNRASGDINILYCQFINNTADGIKTVDGQSIYFDSVEANVNYCTIDTSIYCGSQSVDLNYNWWVVNNTDLDSLIETLPPAAAIKTFAELKISSDAEDIEIGKPVNVLIKLCWNGTENQDNIDLIPIRTAYLDSIGGSISPSSGDLINGLLNTSFMPTSKDILITANVDGVIAASDLSNDDGSAISIYANDISEGEDAAIAITLKNNQSGICLIDIGNGRYYAEIINGSGNVSISGLKAGTYEVIVKFLADDTIASNRKLTVKENPNPENRKDTKIEVESSFSRLANDYTAGERGEYFYAVLKDADGNLLANKTVQIAVNGPVYNVTTDDKGRAGLQVNLAVANTYTYALSFAGDNQYNGAPLASSKLTVTKKPTSISATSKAFKSSAKTKSISVTLKTVKNKDGKTYLRKGKKLTLKVNGKTYTVKTNAKGIAKFSIKLSKKGKFNALIKFAGDKTYKSSAKTVKITIK